MEQIEIDVLSKCRTDSVIYYISKMSKIENIYFLDQCRIIGAGKNFWNSKLDSIFFD